MKKLLSTETRMIVIVALPGMGKTQVAIRVSHLLESEKRRVIYVQKEHTRTRLDICKEILYVLCDDDGMTGNEDDIDIVRQATHKLSKLQGDTVIVLDNTEDIQKEEEEDFENFAQALLDSAPKVKLMITTRRDINTVSADKHKVELEPWDTSSCTTLLQDVATHCGDYFKDICELCGGLPLILIHIGNLLKNHFDPKTLVTELRNNPVDVLKNNSEEVYDLLGKFLRKLPTYLKKKSCPCFSFPIEFLCY